MRDSISRKQKRNLIYKNVLRVQIHEKSTIEHNSQTLQQLHIERNNFSQRYRHIAQKISINYISNVTSSLLKKEKKIILKKTSSTNQKKQKILYKQKLKKRQSFHAINSSLEKTKKITLKKIFSINQKEQKLSIK